MRSYLFLLICSILIISCESNVQKIILEECPKDSVHLLTHHIDSIFVPVGIATFSDEVIVMQNKFPTNLFTFFNRKDFSYHFACGEKGHSNNEFINPDYSYFYATDTSFCVLDSHVEKELQVKNGTIITINKTPIAVFDAINQLVRIGDGKYILSVYMDKQSHEHLLYENGEIKEFGEYKLNLGEKDFIYNFKFTAGLPNKSMIWDFYMYQDLVRGYDINGNLIEEILLDTGYERPFGKNISALETCFQHIAYNEDYIIASYSYYDRGKKIIELQKWNWDGVLLQRFYVPVEFHYMCVSSDQIVYALNAYTPEILYSFSLQ